MSGVPVTELQHGPGTPDQVTLCEVDTDLPDDLQDPLVLDELGDGALAQLFTYRVDGLDHGPIHWVAVDIVDKAAVDLQIIDLEMSELVE